MRNLKKLLALMLATAMVLSVGSFASANTIEDAPDAAKSATLLAQYGDLEDVYANAVQFMLDLGVVKGDGSTGELHLDAQYTRIQFAAMLYISMNGGASISTVYSQMQPYFADIGSGHWGYGYANWAGVTGLFAGTGENKLAPDSLITIEEGLLVVMKALGLRTDLEGLDALSWDGTAQRFVISLAHELGLFGNLLTLDTAGVLNRAEACLLNNYFISAQQIRYAIITGERYRTGQDNVFGLGGTNDPWSLLINKFGFAEAEFVLYADGTEVNMAGGNPANSGKAKLADITLKSGPNYVVQKPSDIALGHVYDLSAALTTQYGVTRKDVGRSVKITYRVPAGGEITQAFSFEYLDEVFETYAGISGNDDARRDALRTITGVSGLEPYNTVYPSGNTTLGNYPVYRNYSPAGGNATAVNADSFYWQVPENTAGDLLRVVVKGSKVTAVFIETYTFANITNVANNGNVSVSTGTGSGNDLANDIAGSRFLGDSSAKGDLVLFAKFDWMGSAAAANIRYMLRKLDAPVEGKVTARPISYSSLSVDVAGAVSTYQTAKVTSALANFSGGTYDVNKTVILYLWEGAVVYGKNPDAAPAAPDVYAVVKMARLIIDAYDFATDTIGNYVLVNVLFTDGQDGTYRLDNIKQLAGGGNATKVHGGSLSAGQYGADSVDAGEDVYYFGSSDQFNAKTLLDDTLWAYELNTNGTITLKEIDVGVDTDTATLLATTTQYRLSATALAGKFLTADTVTFVKVDGRYTVYEGQRVPAILEGALDVVYISQLPNGNVDNTAAGFITRIALINTGGLYDGGSGAAGDWFVALADGYTQVPGEDASKIRGVITPISKGGVKDPLYTADGALSVFENALTVGFKKGMIYTPTMTGGKVTAVNRLAGLQNGVGPGVLEFNLGISALNLGGKVGWKAYDANTIFVDVEGGQFVSAAEASSISRLKDDYIANYTYGTGARANVLDIVAISKGTKYVASGIEVDEDTFEGFLSGETETITVTVLFEGLGLADDEVDWVAEGLTVGGASSGTLTATDSNGDTTHTGVIAGDEGATGTITYTSEAGDDVVVTVTFWEDIVLDDFSEASVRAMFGNAAVSNGGEQEGKDD
ncbi:MAG: hypothetical protein FWG93_02215, partial [Oscillospiraceae bacterium]|nr:hypothetical protein [Oscillospiraceae bacterium]